MHSQNIYYPGVYVLKKLPVCFNLLDSLSDKVSYRDITNIRKGIIFAQTLHLLQYNLGLQKKYYKLKLQQIYVYITVFRQQPAAKVVQNLLASN
jgi:hypothetical protein